MSLSMNHGSVGRGSRRADHPTEWLRRSVALPGPGADRSAAMPQARLVTPGMATRRLPGLVRLAVRLRQEACRLSAEALAVLLSLTGATAAEPLVLDETGFEVSEGYAYAEEALAPGTRGRMVRGGFGRQRGAVRLLSGSGEQAYIGYAPPAPRERVLSVWRPVEVAAPPSRLLGSALLRPDASGQLR